jgi:hypothetical protein
VTARVASTCPRSAGAAFTDVPSAALGWMKSKRLALSLAKKVPVRRPRRGARSLRGRPTRIVFDKWLGHRPLIDNDEARVPSNHPLERLFLVAGTNGEAIVL